MDNSNPSRVRDRALAAGHSVALAVASSAEHSVSQLTAEMITESVPANTSRAYARQLQRFEVWCGDNSRAAYPCTEATLAEFVTYLCTLDLGPSSIEQAMAAIRTEHRNRGYQHQPETRAARMVLKTHRTRRAEAGRGRAKQAPPIVLDTLRTMLENTPADTLIGLRDRVLLVIGFAMMSRRSELASLDIDEVAETPDGLEIYLRKSKTDQDAKGEVVFIPRGKHEDTDPVRVVTRWLAALAERGVTSGRLLRSVNNRGQLSDALHEASINRIVQKAAQRAGIKNWKDYTAHGLRAGGATAAYQAGAPISQISEQGRWSPNSPVVHQYVRAVDKRRDNPMRAVDL